MPGKQRTTGWNESTEKSSQGPFLKSWQLRKRVQGKNLDVNKDLRFQDVLTKVTPIQKRNQNIPKPCLSAIGTRAPRQGFRGHALRLPWAQALARYAILPLEEGDGTAAPLHEGRSQGQVAEPRPSFPAASHRRVRTLDTAHNADNGSRGHHVLRLSAFLSVK